MGLNQRQDVLCTTSICITDKSLAWRADMLGFLSDAPASDQNIYLSHGFKCAHGTASSSHACDGTEKASFSLPLATARDMICVLIHLLKTSPKTLHLQKKNELDFM